MQKALKSPYFFAVQAVFILAVFSQLIKTDSIYVAYLFVAVASMSCLFQNYKRIAKIGYSKNKTDNLVTGILAFLFACMITFSNYKIWYAGSLFNKGINLLFFLIGGFFAFGNILYCILLSKTALSFKQERSYKPLNVFFVTFGIIAVINTLVLFLCNYPGVLTVDSLDEMQQLTTNVYSNHHPFYYTLTVKFFVTVGMHLFHNLNVAIAVYSFFSVIVMAATFAFANATVAELKAPRWVTVLILLFYALMPYNIMYSFTMWKDIFFGAFTLLFVVFLFRCIRDMSLKLLNYIGLIASSFAFCLFRSNGFFVFVFTLLAFFLLWKFKKKAILFIMTAVMLCSFVLKHPVLDKLEITQPDLIESLSIPAQQIARDIKDNNDFSREDTELLSKVVDVDKVPDFYQEQLSDPIKDLVRDRGNQEYIKTHSGEFIGLYLRRIAKHPFTYVKGWIDQTRGYWNGGYSYWRWYDGVQENELGIEKTVNSAGFDRLVDSYLEKFDELYCLQIFLCIGFFNWLLLIVVFISVIKRDKLGAMLTVPSVMTVVSLLVATPVSFEFRYNYAVFCALPIITALVLRTDRRERF